jgi:zinc D-Ala-D-Ala dipeptidase
MIKIDPHELTIMNDLAGIEPIKIDLVYARGDHPENIFRTAIYRADAPFILHRRLADIVVQAARVLHDTHKWILVLKDGLRTIEAQTAVFATPIVKAHPQWVAGPNKMFAGAGLGGHPRGMAVDVSVIDRDGADVDMGTVFDAMPEGEVNPAHRLHADFGSPERTARVLMNRTILTQAFLDGAADCCEPLWPLRHEWWDYRLPGLVFNGFAPLSEMDLPRELRLMPAA